MNIPTLWRTRQQRYQLCSTYCVACGAIWFPPRPICPHCRVHLPLCVQTQTLLLERAPELINPAVAWPQPYALAGLTVQRTESISP